MEEDSYSTAEGAKILKVSDRRVRKLAESGNIEVSQRKMPP